MDGILGELCGLKDRADDEISRNKCHNGDRPKDSDPIQEGDIHASQVLQIGDGNDIHRTAGGAIIPPIMEAVGRAMSMQRPVRLRSSSFS